MPLFNVQNPSGAPKGGGSGSHFSGSFRSSWPWGWGWGAPWLGGYPYGYPYLGTPTYAVSSFPSNPTAQWYLNAMGISCAAWNGIQDIGLRRGMVSRLLATYGMGSEGPDSPRVQATVDLISGCVSSTPVITSTSFGYGSPFGLGNWWGGPGLIRPWGIPLTPFGFGGRVVAAGAIEMPAVSPVMAWVGGAAVGAAATVFAMKKMKKSKK